MLEKIKSHARALIFAAEKYPAVQRAEEKAAAAIAAVERKARGLADDLGLLEMASEAIRTGKGLVIVDTPHVKCPKCAHLVPAEVFSTKTQECTRCRQYAHLGDTTSAIRRERDDARAALRKHAAENYEERIALLDAALADERAQRERERAMGDSLGGLILLIAENCARLGLPQHVCEPADDPAVVGTAVLTELRKISPAPPPEGERSDEGAASNAPAPSMSPRDAAETSAPSSSGDTRPAPWEVSGVPMERLADGWSKTPNGGAWHYFPKGATRAACGVKYGFATRIQPPENPPHNAFTCARCKKRKRPE